MGSTGFHNSLKAVTAEQGVFVELFPGLHGKAV
jgi:hypothetical protein